MKKFLLWCFTLFSFTGLLAQKSEFSPEKWTHIEQRWLESQPVIIAYTGSAEVISGQQIHATSDSLFILQDKGLPLGPDWQKGLVSVNVNEIDYILFQAGGNKLGRRKHARALEFPSSGLASSETHEKLTFASVYVDSLYNPQGLDEAMKHSDILSRAFRKKRIRYSFGAGFGGDPVSKEMQEAVGDSDLPYSKEGWGRYGDVEFLDLSVRFFDRLIIGGALFSRASSAGVYGDSYSEFHSLGYNYNVEYRDHRLYVEYAILNTDRYFSRKFEVIAGTGLLLADVESWFSYHYYDYQDPDYNSDVYYDHGYSDKLLGLQLKAAFHYYFFPGLSFWTALDVNLNQPFVVPEQEIPASGGGNPILLPEHELGFSVVRFKLGLSLYL